MAIPLDLGNFTGLYIAKDKNDITKGFFKVPFKELPQENLVMINISPDQYNELTDCAGQTALERPNYDTQTMHKLTVYKRLYSGRYQAIHLYYTRQLPSVN